MGARLEVTTYENMGGSVDDDEQYERLSILAERLIRRATHDRCDGELSKDAQAAVNHCAYDIIEQLMADATLGGIAQGRDVVAITNDGVSVSFAASGSSTTAAAQSRAFATIRMWLDGVTDARGVQLLYAGADV